MRGYLADRSGWGLGRGIRLAFLVVEMFLAVITLILAAAFLLSFLGANPEAGFAKWVYSRTEAIMTPFEGLFSPLSLGTDMNINVSLLFAIFVYSVLGWALERFSSRV